MLIKVSRASNHLTKEAVSFKEWATPQKPPGMVSKGIGRGLSVTGRMAGPALGGLGALVRRFPMHFAGGGAALLSTLSSFNPGAMKRKLIQSARSV